MSEPASGSSARSPTASRADPRCDVFRLTVESACSGATFLKWLEEHTGLELERLQAAVRHGGIWVDKQRYTAGSAVAAAATISCYAFQREPELGPLPDAGMILFESGPIVAVDKPPWWPIQGTRASRLISLETQLRDLLGRPGLNAVHRLDRETSGVVLFSDDGAASGHLHRQFRARTIGKRYQAIVHPVPTKSAFEVRGYMNRVLHASHSRFELSEVDLGGLKASHTRFEVVESANQRARMVAEPSTGRAHQLRVHLASVGSPIVGDSLYGAGWTEGTGSTADRCLLHAEALRFEWAGQTYEVVAPLPADMKLAAQ